MMLARGKGRIVNLVGGGTGNSFPHGSGYASSKAAIMRFTECLNDTTVGHDVRAFAVDPGLVRTAMTEMQLTSDAGKRFLPGIQQLFDDGINVEPTRAALLIADIAAGRFDTLAGRLLCGLTIVTNSKGRWTRWRLATVEHCASRLWSKRSFEIASREC